MSPYDAQRHKLKVTLTYSRLTKFSAKHKMTAILWEQNRLHMKSSLFVDIFAIFIYRKSSASLLVDAGFYNIIWEYAETSCNLRVLYVNTHLNHVIIQFVYIFTRPVNIDRWKKLIGSITRSPDPNAINIVHGKTWWFRWRVTKNDDITDEIYHWEWFIMAASRWLWWNNTDGPNAYWCLKLNMLRYRQPRYRSQHETRDPHWWGTKDDVQKKHDLNLAYNLVRNALVNEIDNRHHCSHQIL